MFYQFELDQLLNRKKPQGNTIYSRHCKALIKLMSEDKRYYSAKELRAKIGIGRDNLSRFLAEFCDGAGIRSHRRYKLNSRVVAESAK